MTKLTNGIFLGSILGLFLSIVVYFFAPDLYPVYPNVLSVFFFIAVASAILMVIFKKLKYKNHSEQSGFFIKEKSPTPEAHSECQNSFSFWRDYLFQCLFCHPSARIDFRKQSRFCLKKKHHIAKRNSHRLRQGADMFSLHVDFGEACGFYSSNNVLRIKCELGGVGIHSVHLL